MDRVDYTLQQALCLVGDDVKTIAEIGSDIAVLMRRKDAMDITHGDMHTGNIAFSISDSGKYDITLIDFGQSSTITSNPVVDAEQLVSGLMDVWKYKYSKLIVEPIQEVLDSIADVNGYQLKGTREAFIYEHDEYQRDESISRDSAGIRTLAEILSQMQLNTISPHRYRRQERDRYGRIKCGPGYRRNRVTQRCRLIKK